MDAIYCALWLPKFGRHDGLAFGNSGYKLTHVNSGIKTTGFCGVALFAVIFYASGIPRVQYDILQVWQETQHW